MSFSLGEYQDIFLEEADEQLQELNQNLLELEKNPENFEIINDIFRAAHSLKSSAAFVGLNDLSNLAHKMENLLQGIRDKTLKITPEIVDVIFKCFDEITSVIDSVASGKKPEQDLSGIMKKIQEVSTVPSENTGSVPASGSKAGSTTAGSKGLETIISDNEKNEIIDAIDNGNYCKEITVTIDETAQMKWVKAQLIISNMERSGTIIKTIPPSEELSSDDMGNVFKVILSSDEPEEIIKNGCNVDLVIKVELADILVGQSADGLVLDFAPKNIIIGADADDSPVQVKTAEEKIEDHIDDDMDDHEDDHADVELTSQLDKKLTSQIEQERKKSLVLKTVKVPIEKLDQLLNNVGELVIANSGFYKLYEEIKNISSDKTAVNEFKNRMEGMSRIAKDLQTGIMKTRMVQIGQIFSRFKRLVRDLTKEFDKKIELVIKGEDTELDKKVIDVIGEPLLHLIRNAIDHGVESEEEREKAGKAEVATVTLNSYQGGNHIFVEVSDDGRGLNIERIKKKALEKGLATAENIVSMDDNDIFNFIFSAGFSTADTITDVSGRGVGMNVVKQVVNDLNGSVNIETEVGMGTRFVLTFPLTLAIIPAIMVRVQAELYAIPLSDVIETIKISQSDITTIEGHEVINLRGEVLSLLRLNHFIDLDSALGEDQKIPVVVVGFGNRKIGLLVDYLDGKLEIVIKSLEQNYKNVEGLAGASILGDGSICLILDIATMINKVITDQDKLSKMKKQAIIEKGTQKFENVKIEEEVESKKEFVDIDIDAAKRELEDERKKAEIESETKISATDEAEGEQIIDHTQEEVKPELESSAADREMPVEIEDDDIIIESESIIPVDDERDVEIETQVSETLDTFRQDLKDQIKDSLGDVNASEHMEESLGIIKDDLKEIQSIANIGATDAAASLSKIVNMRIDLSIPEVSIKPIDKIPEFIGDVDNVYIGVMMPADGDIKGTLLFILKEDIGFNLINLLYGMEQTDSKELNEDGESALKEITNIIGSSIINVIAEKTQLTIKPLVPSIIHDYMQSVIDSILVLHNMQSDYAVIMDTSFYFEDDRLIGNLLFFPEKDSLKKLIEGIKSNVG